MDGVGTHVGTRGVVPARPAVRLCRLQHWLTEEAGWYRHLYLIRWGSRGNFVQTVTVIVTFLGYCFHARASLYVCVPTFCASLRHQRTPCVNAGWHYHNLDCEGWCMLATNVHASTEILPSVTCEWLATFHGISAIQAESGVCKSVKQASDSACRQFAWTCKHVHANVWITDLLLTRLLAASVFDAVNKCDTDVRRDLYQVGYVHHVHIH